MADADVAAAVKWAGKQRLAFWAKLALLVGAGTGGIQGVDQLMQWYAQRSGMQLASEAERQHDLLRIETDAKIEKVMSRIDQRFDKLTERIDTVMAASKK